MRHLLDKEPDRRFPSAEALLEVLVARRGRPRGGTARAAALRAATQRPLRRVRIPRETTAVRARCGRSPCCVARYRDAQAGDGRVLLIEGEAGIGKTRLVDEVVAGLRRDGEDLDFLFGSYPPGGAATGAGAFSTAYREHLGTDDLE